MRIFLRIIESVPIYILLLRIFKRVFARNSKVYSKVEFRELKSSNNFLPILLNIDLPKPIVTNYPDFHFFGENILSFRTKDKPELLNIHTKFLDEITQKITEGYEYFDWQLDVKSGFRFDIRKQFNQQNSEVSSVDIKVPWELGRMQHLPNLSVEILSDKRGVEEYKNQVLDFIGSNPVGMGVQWACSMDAGIRVVNLLLSFDLLFEKLKNDQWFCDLFLSSIDAHARFIFDHLEYKEGLTGNHYLFNLIGLLFAATYLEETVATQQWKSFSIIEIEKEIFKQFFEDGGNIEGSTAYHCLSTEIMIYATSLMLRNGFKPSKEYMKRLYLSGKFIADITKPNYDISQFGDNDSGRLFKFLDNETLNYTDILAAFSGLFSDSIFDKYGEKYPIVKQIIQQLLKEVNYFTPELITNITKTASYNKLKYSKQISIPFNDKINLKDVRFISYSDFGIHLYKSKEFYLAISSISNIKMHHSWGHAHNDKLSFELQVRGKDLVRDSGSYCYTSNAKMRNQFRSTKAHHSIVVGSIEQNKWIEESNWGLFYLDRETRCKVIEATEDSITLQAKYYGIYHIRIFKINSTELIITDYCNKPFEININKFEKYSVGYGVLSNVT